MWFKGFICPNAKRSMKHNKIIIFYYRCRQVHAPVHQCVKRLLCSTFVLIISILTLNTINIFFQDKINFDAGIQLYFNNVPDDKQQRLDLQQIKQYVHISEFKNKLILTPLLTQSDDEGTNIKYYNKADPVSKCINFGVD